MISASGRARRQHAGQNQVLGALTANDTRQRFVAISGMVLTIAVNPGATVGYSPFGYRLYRQDQWRCYLQRRQWRQRAVFQRACF